MRVRWAVVALFVVSLGLTWLVYQWVPRAFVPEEDQGWFITIIQAPAGASLEATSNVAREAEQRPDGHAGGAVGLLDHRLQLHAAALPTRG